MFMFTGDTAGLRTFPALKF